MNLVDRKILTPEGREALIKLTDPFHDTIVKFPGIPDSLPEPSIVREPKKQWTISNPQTDKTLPFDVHIFSLPERNEMSVSGVEYATGSISQWGQFEFDGSGPFNGVPIGPLVAVAVPAGSATTPANSAWPPNMSQSSLTVFNFDEYYSGQSRETYSGVEVHNVTNPLNVGGAVTVYRLPNFTYPSQISVYDSSSGNPTDCRGCFGLVSRMPPGDVGSAMKLAASVTYEAKDGAYVVESFRLEENLPQTGASAIRAFVAGDVAGGNITGSELPCMIAWVPDSQSGGKLGLAPNCKAVSKDTSGIYFTGLPGASQLTVNVRKGIETFPSYTSEIVDLAQPTPDYDPVFFELYKRICQELPPGVAVGENASGDFWDSILGLVGDIAPTVGSMFGPAGALLGNAIGGGAKAIKGAPEKKKAEKEDTTTFKKGLAPKEGGSMIKKK
jgi:hypothetical protein